MPRAIYRFPLLLLKERRANGHRTRDPEPMVWQELEAVEEFHRASETANALRAVYDISARSISALTPEGGHLLDLGSGSGQFLAFLSRRRPDMTMVGLELSPPMIEKGREMLAEEGLADKLALETIDVTDLPEEVAGRPTATISCLLTLHHLPDADSLDACLRGLAELRERHGCAIWLFDLVRLRNPDVWPAWTHITDPHVAQVLRDDAVASEKSAWTVDELRERLAAAGLGDLRHASSSLVPMLQAWWAPARSGAEGPKELWNEIPLDKPAKGDAQFMRASFKNGPKPH